jgi:broad specificity phosphatase PhoE
MPNGGRCSCGPGTSIASWRDRPAATVLIVVRHGRTASNAAGLLLGHADPSLDAVGKDQAAAIGATIEQAGLVITSPLARCRETAAALGGPVEVDERWIELDYGEWDGRPVADVPADTWRQWRADPDFRPPGGESLAALGRRVGAAGTDALERARDQDVVVVTHVSPIKAVVAWSLGAGDEVTWRTHVAQASITRVDHSGRGPVLTGFNDVSHLR